jgi:hypothetical protein
MTDVTSEDYLTLNSDPTGGSHYPFSCGGWIRVQDEALTATEYFFSVGNDSSNYDAMFALTSGQVRQISHRGTAITDILGGNVEDYAWHHLFLVCVSATERHSWLDGSKFSDTNDCGSNSTNARCRIGGRTHSAIFASNNTAHAEFAFWNAEVTDASVASLYAGASPKMIQPEDLTNYISMAEGTGNLRDEVSGELWTATGGTHTDVDHPALGRLYKPGRVVVGMTPTAAPAGHAGPLVDAHRLRSKTQGLVA